MGKEMGFANFRHETTNSCRIESYVTAAANVDIGRLPHVSKITIAIGKDTYDYYFLALFKLLEDNGFGHILHEIIEVPAAKATSLHALIAALEGGAICELTVNSRQWFKNVLFINPASAGIHYNHSILVHGYYQPLEKNGPTYFYLYDSYYSTHAFVAWDKIHDSLDKNDDVTCISLLGLCFDHAGLVPKYKKNFDKKTISKAQAKILDNLPGKNKKDKLAWLLR